MDSLPKSPLSYQDNPQIHTIETFQQPNMTTRMSLKKTADLVSKPHPHHETGITDEAAVEGYDLIHNAEVEEEKASLFLLDRLQPVESLAAL